MAWRLSNLGELSSGPLTAPALEALLKRHVDETVPRLSVLWNYYRNPMEPAGGWSIGRAAGRAYRLAQERGLPPRLTGRPSGLGSAWADDRAANRREIVIENDIAWRVHAMTDFLFGKAVRVVPTVPDAARAQLLGRVLESAWEGSGGASMLQDAALLGHVYGCVDLLVRVPPDLAARAAAARDERGGLSEDRLVELAALVRIEPVPAVLGIPVVGREDYRRLDAYILRSVRAGEEPGAAAVTRIEILAPAWRQVYEDRNDEAGPRLIEEGENPLGGVLPVVHVQNVSQPLAYFGLSEVEPLIPLQDELNTRLSDRASRVTMQSFKMYLARGVEGFDRAPIGPGQVWSTDNPQASIEAFGGDAASPSEDAHIEQVREAMDKASSVPPLATGVVRARVGNLSSENALRLTLQGLLARTERKRLLYGRGIVDASRLVLAALDHAGVLATAGAERAVRVEWPELISRDRGEDLAAAKAKRALGITRERVLSELGYGPGDAGVE